ncbi:MAG: hypothetical protein ABII12_03205 [Planctomycetota bacterium]
MSVVDDRAGGGAADDGVADRVLAMLRTMGAYGATRARPQAEVARAIGIDTRRLQQATLVLNLRGEPVVSRCVRPFGVFIAEGEVELQAYRKQLHSRLVGNGRRLGAVNRMIRAWVAEADTEPGGQRRLQFA